MESSLAFQIKLFLRPIYSRFLEEAESSATMHGYVCGCQCCYQYSILTDRDSVLFNNAILIYY